MRLNKKGLTLTELIVSFAIVAVAVVYFYQTLYTVRKLYTTAQTETQEFVDKTYAIKMVDSYYDNLKENGTISDENLKQACSTFNLKYLDKNECTSISAVDVEGEPNLKKITIKWGNNSSDPSVVFHKSLVSASPISGGSDLPPNGPNKLIPFIARAYGAKPWFDKNNIDNINKEDVETIKFASTRDKPEGYESGKLWDASLYRNHAVVVRYKKNENGKYELTIGGADKVIFPEDSHDFFSGFTNLKTISFNNGDESYIKTGSVQNMSNMFYDCKSLIGNISTKILDLSSFQTYNVSEMEEMFMNCESLIGINLNSFNISNVSTMSSMFEGCTNLKELDLKKFGNNTRMYYTRKMFYNCSNLESIDLSNFNPTYVQSIGSMFEGCRSLKTLKLNKFNPPKVTSTSSMFKGCSSLTNLDLTKFDMTEVYDTNSMFEGCTSLETIDFNLAVRNKLRSFPRMFYNCRSLTSLRFPFHFKNSNSIGKTDYEDAFEGVKNNIPIIAGPDEARFLRMRFELTNVIG